MKQIIHNRLDYYEDATLGVLIVNGVRFCFTLEDAIRAYSIKVKGKTGIPENSNMGYKVGIKYSNKFKRDVLVLYTDIVNGIYELNFGGISFTDIYAHGGNDEHDTDGCVLVAYNRYDNKIQGTAEKELFNIVKEWITKGDEVRWITTNM